MGLTRNQFIDEISNTFDIAYEICVAKNEDYANGDDPFLNFRSAVQVGLTPEQGIVVRMQDKLTRVGNVIANGRAAVSETLEDTLLDLINYAAILKVYLQNER